MTGHEPEWEAGTDRFSCKDTPNVFFLYDCGIEADHEHGDVDGWRKSISCNLQRSP